MRATLPIYNLDDTAEGVDQSLVAFKKSVIVYHFLFEQAFNLQKNSTFRTQALFSTVYVLCTLLEQTKTLAHPLHWLESNSRYLFKDISQLHNMAQFLKKECSSLAQPLTLLNHLFVLYLRFPVGCNIEHLSLLPQLSLSLTNDTARASAPIPLNPLSSANVNSNIAASTTTPPNELALSQQQPYKHSINSLLSYLKRCPLPTQQNWDYLNYLMYGCQLRLLIVVEEILTRYPLSLLNNKELASWLLTQILVLREVQEDLKRESRRGLALEVADDLVNRAQRVLKEKSISPKNAVEWLEKRRQLHENAFLREVREDQCRFCPTIFKVIKARVMVSKIKALLKTVRENIAERREQEIQDLEAANKDGIAKEIQGKTTELQEGAMLLKSSLERMDYYRTADINGYITEQTENFQQSGALSPRP